MKIIVNGESREINDGTQLGDLLTALELSRDRIAVEHNRRVVPRNEYDRVGLSEGDEIEVVTIVGGGQEEPPAVADWFFEPLQIAGHSFSSRLFVGTGKYASFELMRDCLEASGTDCVTVAVRRVDLKDRSKPNLLDYIDRDRYTILPNTAGCYNAEDAVRYARLSREVLGTDLVKLEVLADDRTLLPDPLQTLEACKTLVADGFTVLCYTSDDPVMALRLEDAGAASVMPAGSPIGSGQGVLNPNNLRIILERAKVPIVCDAGVGTASDVSIAMELGCAGVLLNTAIAHAENPLAMAHAMKHACFAGRLAYRAGRIPKKLYAQASSPVDGRIQPTAG